MNLNYWDQMLGLVYITIENLDSKTWCSQTWPSTPLFGSILVVYEWSEDEDNKDKDLKAKIYHLALKIML